MGGSMAAAFKPGDIVQLKSGGPAMTVAGKSSFKEGYYNCTWFKGASKEHGEFLEATLKTYEAPKK